MKKSDKKQFENAWENFYIKTKNLMDSLDSICNMQDEDFTVDDLNQISNNIDKLTKTIKRVGEKCIYRREYD